MYVDKLGFTRESDCRVLNPASGRDSREMRQGAAGQSLQGLIIQPLPKPAGGAGSFPLTSERRGRTQRWQIPLNTVEPMNPFSLGSIYKRWFISNVLFPYQFWLLVGLNKDHLWHFFFKVESALNFKWHSCSDWTTTGLSRCKIPCV